MISKRARLSVKVNKYLFHRVICPVNASEMNKKLPMRPYECHVISRATQ